jgi:hypothetical protein
LWFPERVEIVPAQSATIGGLVEVAYAENRLEGELIEGLLLNAGFHSLLKPVRVNGPMLGIGLLPGSPQRVMVDPGDADAARRVLEETLAAEDLEGMTVADAAEPGGGREPRSYGVLGAYARIWLFGFGAMALAFGAFLLIRAV